MISRSSKLIVLGLTAALLLLAIAASSALASKNQLSVIEDPARQLSADVATRHASLDESKALGAEIVKIPVLWRTYAPDGAATVKPSGDLTNPANYPAGVWDALDASVAGAQARGMKVWLMITAPAPRWAVSKETSPGLGAYQPDPADYAEFVKAVGRRYANVQYFSFWNEVNLKRFMQPQSKSGLVQSAIHYRDMYRAAYVALGKSGHASDTILFGEVLGRYPANQPTKQTFALKWLREFFCIDTRGRALGGSAAKRHKCSGFKAIKSSGIAYHPYNAFGGPLATEKASRDNAAIGYLLRLEKLLDQAHKAKRLAAGKLKIYSSEYGFQTDPPDRTTGNQISKVPYYLSASEYISWKDPRVATYSQYLLVDDAELSGFQSGLRFIDGTKKEAIYASYVTPFMAFKTPSSSRITVWGKLRGKHSGTVSVSLQVQQSGGDWSEVTTIPVSASSGYFMQDVAVPSANTKNFRLSWSGGVSRETRPIAPIKAHTN